MAVGTLSLFVFGPRPSGARSVALTMAFTTFVLFQMFNVFNARTENGSRCSAARCSPTASC